MYLLIENDGTLKQLKMEGLDDLLPSLACGDADVVRFRGNVFELAVVIELEAEEVNDEPTYDLSWEPIPHAA